MKLPSYLSRALALSLTLFAVLLSGSSSAQEARSLEPTPASLAIVAPKIALKGVGFELTIEARDEDGQLVKSFSSVAALTGVRQEATTGQIVTTDTVAFVDGQAKIEEAIFAANGLQSIGVAAGGLSATAKVRVIPAILSILPPLIAIGLALLARQVLLSLFCGVWIGSVFIYGYNPFIGFGKAIDTYLVQALIAPEHAAILIFSLTLGGMVGVIAKAGGTQGIVQKLSKYARTPRGGQLATWAMGVLIFFDDYANSLIVGNTMRPFTDRLRISREKLSYIVDSTAAPVASIALVSTWIGFQVGLVDQALKAVGSSENAYNIFLQSIPYASYSILALLFVFLIGFTRRDFGPMLTAERRAIDTGKVLREGALPLTDSSALDMIADEDTPLRWYNALLPIICVIGVTLLGLYFNGKSVLGDEAATATLGQIFGAANSFHVLMWASFIGLLVASILAIGQRLLSLDETLNAAVNGYKAMMMAAMILILAWSIGDICADLQTANYIIKISQGLLSPHVIPVLTFVVSALIAFSTGTSWSTMAILTPIVVPIATYLPGEAGLSAELAHVILIATVGSVLSGSVLGDHCSPISDTTILSSMASAADHGDHVRTQMPYAISVGLIACLTGYLPSGWGWNVYLMLLAGIGLLVALVFGVGKRRES